MKEKFVEERYPRYFEFGQSNDGRVDVSSTLIDPVATVCQEQAQVLIEDRDKVINMLVALAKALDEVAPEKFKAIWYGEENPEYDPMETTPMVCSGDD